MKIFKHKTIVITGGAIGLGLATAKILAAKGASLSIIDYNEEALETAKKEIQSENADCKIITIIADVPDEKAVKNYVEKTIKEFGTVEGFYNNAGIEGKQALLANYDVDTFKKVIDVNLMGVYYGMKYIIPEMKKNCGG
jgi:NADP-dependent 3-hydroxy acid dehydrogenase YdfG